MSSVQASHVDARQALRVAAALALGSAIALGLGRFSYALLLQPMRTDLGWSYLTAGAMNTVNAGGYLVMATFGPEGPTRCSGLPVERYDAARLAAMLGDEFALLEQTTAIHRTPGGAEQQFQYALFRRQR